jgi:hypothetical protein
VGNYPATPPRPSAPMSSPLAYAFLALADDDPLPDQRTLPRVLVAALAAFVLAIGLPLAVSMQHPVAALSSKVTIVDE